MEETIVYLKCVKEQRKLRIKIISPGYHQEANCQFPKDIRIDGRKYSVPSYAITFSEGPNHKFFYRINKSFIKIVNESDIPNTQQHTINKLYEDPTDSECVVCMTTEKEVVFIPCGHYCLCKVCALRIKDTNGKCIMCRSIIEHIISRDQIQI